MRSTKILLLTAVIGLVAVGMASSSGFTAIESERDATVSVVPDGAGILVLEAHSAPAEPAGVHQIPILIIETNYGETLDLDVDMHPPGHAPDIDYDATVSPGAQTVVVATIECDEGDRFTRSYTVTVEATADGVWIVGSELVDVGCDVPIEEPESD